MSENRRRTVSRTATLTVAAVAAAALLPAASAVAAPSPAAHTGAKSTAAASATTDGQHAAKRTLIRTQKLAGGFTGKVYKVSQKVFEADLIAPDPDTGKPIVWDTLRTNGDKPAYGEHNGAHFVLHPGGTMTSWVEKAEAKPAPHAAKLTASADKTTVKAWEQFHVSGKATGVQKGTKVSLQQYQAKNKKWATLPASTTVKSDGSYQLRAKLGLKGANKLRMTGAGAVSNPVTVTVR
ncbi:hypothetical protein [Streptomyces sp. ODS28]|uniref:hypothetical protein n=1 Tax=Streptomyces sp. ODS28 TaxID=3136688 RepID=UPI0031EE3DCE